VTRGALAASLALLLPTVAYAGPPFLTDDPEPTETGHWEVYAPLVEAAGSGRDYEGAVAAEINYGLVKDVQLTVGLPVAFERAAGQTHVGTADLEASLKYRVYNDAASGIQIAVFPGITLPTGSSRMSAGHVTALLPVWAQKNAGAWSVFGGGGYAINPGGGNRDFWTGGVALAREVSERLTVGLEANVEGPSEIGSSVTTILGLGSTYDLPGPLRLLASAGPSFGNGNGFHAFMALGIDY